MRVKIKFYYRIWHPVMGEGKKFMTLKKAYKAFMNMEGDVILSRFSYSNVVSGWMADQHWRKGEYKPPKKEIDWSKYAPGVGIVDK